MKNRLLRYSLYGLVIVIITCGVAILTYRQAPKKWQPDLSAYKTKEIYLNNLTNESPIAQRLTLTDQTSVLTFNFDDTFNSAALADYSKLLRDAHFEIAIPEIKLKDKDIPYAYISGDSILDIHFAELSNNEVTGTIIGIVDNVSYIERSSAPDCTMGDIHGLCNRLIPVKIKLVVHFTGKIGAGL